MKPTIKPTVNSIRRAKGQTPLAMITAYDALFAQLFDQIADMILVGDSLNMSFSGKRDTLSATLDQMIYHTQAVCNGAPDSFIICDMPFGTYNTPNEALDNAIRVYQETGADAVKIEGGLDRADIIRHLCQHGIAVCGHIGLLPQSVRSEGAYKIRGKDGADAQRLIEDAVAVEEAGAFCMVVEGVKSDVAERIAQNVRIPVIGIGAGFAVDGQVLVFSDLLGLNESHVPKFVKQYLSGANLVRQAVQNYKNEVTERKFPDERHIY